MIYEENELYEIEKIIDFSISVDGDAEIAYLDKNGEQQVKWVQDKHIVKLFEMKDKEIERLNNIIEELEKWLEEMRFEDIAIAPDEALDKLKELKEK